MKSKKYAEGLVQMRRQLVLGQADDLEIPASSADVFWLSGKQESVQGDQQDCGAGMEGVAEGQDLFRIYDPAFVSGGRRVPVLWLCGGADGRAVS